MIYLLVLLSIHMTACLPRVTDLKTDPKDPQQGGPLVQLPQKIQRTRLFLLTSNIDRSFSKMEPIISSQTNTNNQTDRWNHRDFRKVVGNSIAKRVEAKAVRMVIIRRNKSTGVHLTADSEVNDPILSLYPEVARIEPNLLPRNLLASIPVPADSTPADHIVALMLGTDNVEIYEISSSESESKLVEAAQRHITLTNQNVLIAAEDSTLHEKLSTPFLKDQSLEIFNHNGMWHVSPAVANQELNVNTRIITYKNGFVDEINRTSGEVTRYFPSGRKEIGSFAAAGSRALTSGIIAEKGSQTYINPSIVATGRDIGENATVIANIDGHPVPLLEIPFEASHYKVSGKNPFQALFEISRMHQIEDMSIFRMGTFPVADFLDFLQQESPTDGVPRFKQMSLFFAASLFQHVQSLNIKLPEDFIDHFVLAAASDPDLHDDFFRTLLPRKSTAIMPERILNTAIAGAKVEKTSKVKIAYRVFYNELSDYDRLRARIVLADPTLTNDGFDKLAATFTQAQKQALYDTAYRYANPFVFEKASNTVKASDYSLNFLWINRSPIPEHTTNILGKSPQAFEEEILRPLEQWSKLQPDRATIYMWYDSSLISVEAKNETMRLLKAKFGEKVRLRDIRELQVVKDHPTPFDGKVPVYFRVDLAKAVIADQLMKHEKTKYVVTADLDIGAISAEQIFDKRTLAYLNRGGYVLNKHDAVIADFENSFIVLRRDAKGLAASHRELIIDRAIMEVEQGRIVPAERVFALYKDFDLERRRSTSGWISWLRSLVSRESLQVDDAFRKPMTTPESRFSSIDGKIKGTDGGTFQWIPAQKKFRVIK